jgi:hypothetical protein
VPSAAARHLYAAATGALLSYFSFGAASNVYFGILMLVSYASMLFSRRHCGIITFVIAFALLITCHVMYMSGDAWKKGGIDSTGKDLDQSILLDLSKKFQCRIQNGMPCTTEICICLVFLWIN